MLGRPVDVAETDVSIHLSFAACFPLPMKFVCCALCYN